MGLRHVAYMRRIFEKLILKEFKKREISIRKEVIIKGRLSRARVSGC